MKNDSAQAVVIAMVMKTLLFVILVLLLIFSARRAYDFGYRVFAQETVSDPPGKKIAITITEGMSIQEIAELLEGRNVIKDADVFRIQYLLSEYKGQQKAGSYVLNSAMTGEEVLRALAGKGDTGVETDSKES